MASLDMSLDDLIKSRKNSNKGGRSQGRPPRGGRRYVAPQRNPLGVNVRPSSHTIAKSLRGTKNLPWKNGLFEDSLKAAGLSAGLETGTKLHIFNLGVGVTNEDIRELFSEIGEIMRYAIHYDQNGRPSGSAEVVFARRSDAFQAIKRYNNVQLDGRPMNIEITGRNAKTPVSAHLNIVRGPNMKRGTVAMLSRPGRYRVGFVAANRGFAQNGRGGLSNGRGGGRGRGGRRGHRGGSGGGRGHGGAHWRKKTGKSADELDKELDNYHAEAMQT